MASRSLGDECNVLEICNKHKQILDSQEVAMDIRLFDPCPVVPPARKNGSAIWALLLLLFLVTWICTQAFGFRILFHARRPSRLNPGAVHPSRLYHQAHKDAKFHLSELVARLSAWRERNKPLNRNDLTRSLPEARTTDLVLLKRKTAGCALLWPPFVVRTFGFHLSLWRWKGRICGEETDGRLLHGKAVWGTHETDSW